MNEQRNDVSDETARLLKVLHKELLQTNLSYRPFITDNNSLVHAYMM